MPKKYAPEHLRVDVQEIAVVLHRAAGEIHAAVRADAGGVRVEPALRDDRGCSHRSSRAFKRADARVDIRRQHLLQRGKRCGHRGRAGVVRAGVEYREGFDRVRIAARLPPNAPIGEPPPNDFAIVTRSGLTP